MRRAISNAAAVVLIVSLVGASIAGTYFATISRYSSSVATSNTFTLTVTSTVTSTISLSSSSAANTNSLSSSSAGATNSTAAYQAYLNTLITGAKQEGNLLIYTDFAIPAIAGLIGNFTKLYPFINAQYVRAGGTDIYNRVTTEFQGGVYKVDVLVPFLDYQMTQLKAMGALANYQPMSATYITPAQRDPDWAYSVVFDAPISIVYNTKLVNASQLPKDYPDLLAPQWKGKLGMVNIQTDPQDMVPLLYQASQIYGPNFLPSLAKQNIFFPTSSTVILAQDVAMGQVPVGVFASPQNLPALQAQGYPIDWIHLSGNKYMAYVATTGIASHAPHPYSAKLFEEFMYSPMGQQVLASYGYPVLSQNAKLALPALSPGNKTIVSIPSLPNSTFNQLLQNYSTLFGLG